MVNAVETDSKLPGVSTQKTFLCTTHDVVENSARGFDNSVPSLFVVKQAGKFYVYLNRCPHAGTELNWSADVFLTSDRALIICATHGALFVKESGLCVGGPCQGKSLQSLPFVIEDEKIYLLDHQNNLN
jgi:nitrite reductase/ring-hydroxylating ferredoxin subunit